MRTGREPMWQHVHKLSFQSQLNRKSSSVRENVLPSIALSLSGAGVPKDQQHNLGAAVLFQCPNPQSCDHQGGEPRFKVQAVTGIMNLITVERRQAIALRRTARRFRHARYAQAKPVPKGLGIGDLLQSPSLISSATRS